MDKISYITIALLSLLIGVPCKVSSAGNTEAVLCEQINQLYHRSNNNPQCFIRSDWWSFVKETITSIERLLAEKRAADIGIDLALGDSDRAAYIHALYDLIDNKLGQKKLNFVCRDLDMSYPAEYREKYQREQRRWLELAAQLALLPPADYEGVDNKTLCTLLARYPVERELNLVDLSAEKERRIQRLVSQFWVSYNHLKAIEESSDYGDESDEDYLGFDWFESLTQMRTIMDKLYRLHPKESFPGLYHLLGEKNIADTATAHVLLDLYRGSTSMSIKLNYHTPDERYPLTYQRAYFVAQRREFERIYTTHREDFMSYYVSDGEQEEYDARYPATCKESDCLEDIFIKMRNLNREFFSK